MPIPCLRTDLEIARKTGALSELALGLSARIPVLVFCGEFAAAASLVAETKSVEEATGISAAPYGALIVSAWRGQVREAAELIEATIRDAGSRGEGIGIAISEYARAVLCNGSGHYEEGLVAARGASEYQEVVAENWGLSEVIESATRSGRTDVATDALNRLAKKAQASGTGWALGIEARSRALMSDGDVAEGLFREAIAHLDRTRVRAEASPCSPAVRGVASTDEPPGGRAQRVEHRVRDVQRDGHGRVRGTCAAGTARHRRDSAETQRRDPR